VGSDYYLPFWKLWLKRPRNPYRAIINYLTDEQAASNSLEDFLKLIKQLQPEDKKVDKKFDFILTKRIGNHNTKEFLKGLNEWKHYVLGENRFNPADYDIENKCDWKTSLRYGDESKTNNSEQDDAKYALKMAINFLKNVVRLEDKSVVFECENKFSEINKSISQKSESISSVENEILSKEQTLNNED
jgi:hypothetical protein